MENDDELIKSYGASAAEIVDKYLNGLSKRQAWILTTSIFIYCVRHMIIMAGMKKTTLVLAEAILTAPGIEAELETKQETRQ